MSSAYLSKGTTLEIDACGIKNSLRKARDGYTYFGCKKNIHSGFNEDTGGSILGTTKIVANDFVIPAKSEDDIEKHRGRQFQIWFDVDQNKYFIKDLGIGYGAFMKLTAPLPLKDNYLINIGESYIVANILPPSEELQELGIEINVPRLRLKIFSVVKSD